MGAPELTPDMIAVLCLLGFTVFLFVTEVVRVDLAALLVMVLLGLLSFFPGLENIADVNHLFDGFASNAVISIIAVMIIGAGLDKTGIMGRVAGAIVKHGGKTEKRIVPILSGTVGVISSFMQNVGAAALFLPVVSRISTRTGLPLSRLLMPMGFCAILGGTLTMVGSSPLILLNDLIVTTNRQLAAEDQMALFSLFSVTPVGIALVLAGITYFVLFGKWVLPKGKKSPTSTTGQSLREYLKRIYGLNAEIYELIVPAGSAANGQTLDDLMQRHHVYIIGTFYKGQRFFAPVITTQITSPCRIAVLGRYSDVVKMAKLESFDVSPTLEVFAEDYAPTRSGVAEMVIPPDSTLIGKSGHDIVFRKKYAASLLAIQRTGDTFSYIETEDHEATPVGEVPFQAGDMLVVHCTWSALGRLIKDRDFVVVTSDFPREELRPKKLGWAVAFFLLALGLVLFSEIRLSLCLLTGAVGMIVFKVLDADEAYAAVSWSTVFLLASLIPLGQAVQGTGTAEWIAAQILTILNGWPIWGIQAGVAVLATIFTLIMSNVGATVLLVPLAVSIALAAGGDPAVFAMTVAISTSNSFLIPTHQVNALIMGPADYKVIDFVRTGGIMTIIFLVVSLVMINLVF